MAGGGVGEDREGDRPESGEAGEDLLLLRGGGPLLVFDLFDDAVGPLLDRWGRSSSARLLAELLLIEYIKSLFWASGMNRPPLATRTPVFDADDG
jgi:hypothetical protein